MTILRDGKDSDSQKFSVGNCPAPPRHDAAEWQRLGEKIWSDIAQVVS